MKLRPILAWSWTFVILLLCWLPRMYIPGQEEIPKPFFLMNIDKYVHTGIFAVFAVLWMRVGESSRRTLWVALAGMALAAISEIGQENRFVNRDASVADFLADILGVVIAIAGYWLVALRASRRLLRTRSAETP